jgi:hypothetical protein
MLLAKALFALLLGGFWLYCLTDALLTPASECKGMPKPAWIAVIAATFIGGAVAWLIVRQPVRTGASHLDTASRWDRDDFIDDENSPDSQRWTDEDDAVARHPAGRARLTDSATRLTDSARGPKGPDDDQDFLRALDRVIRGSYEAGDEI